MRRRFLRDKQEFERHAERGWVTTHKALRNLIGDMLCFVHPVLFQIDDDADGFTVKIGDTHIAFIEGDGPIDQQLERLATMIEGSIAYTRAQAMLVAAGAPQGALPLWLVTGSSVLASWLSWSRTEMVLRRRLALTAGPDAPVMGTLDRRARQNFGQPGVRIRVRHGLAVADKIELPGRLKCIAALGHRAKVRIEGNPLPETLITALNDDPRCNNRRRIAEVVDHPFFAATDLRLAGIRNDGDAVVIDVESDWEPLAPVPDRAWAAVPPDADPACPWRATPREVAALYRLVDAGRGHVSPA